MKIQKSTASWRHTAEALFKTSPLFSASSPSHTRSITSDRCSRSTCARSPLRTSIQPNLVITMISRRCSITCYPKGFTCHHRRMNHGSYALAWMNPPTTEPSKPSALSDDLSFTGSMPFNGFYLRSMLSRIIFLLLAALNLHESAAQTVTSYKSF